jgi:hypothetical protein
VNDRIAKVDNWDLPIDAISCASIAAAEKQGMGALHVGSHVLLALINEGFVLLTDEALSGRTARQAADHVRPHTTEP